MTIDIAINRIATWVSVSTGTVMGYVDPYSFSDKFWNGIYHFDFWKAIGYPFIAGFVSYIATRFCGEIYKWYFKRRK